LTVKFTVLGKLVSMKNRKQRTRYHGDVKNAATRKFEHDFMFQVPSEYRGLQLGSLTVPLSARVTVFYPSRRSDLDAALVYDCLQNSGVIKNDRYITEKVERACVDPKNPRVEIELFEAF
jgi:Holliday junction resolvase RusA-like endonuclease